MAAPSDSITQEAEYFHLNTNINLYHNLVEHISLFAGMGPFTNLLLSKKEFPAHYNGIYHLQQLVVGGMLKAGLII
ncbi:hypothetical protein [Chondrinema litorale]|uniref:hypothetical protein n=1 Tax=Chondrinema litorale TaxID=2994555 RepID=UPI002543D322|nr:hypothetical protein [Chondrinema litorale]UZR99859.1 hypothetical protein OQ292_38385 [Chondrinema litorale]